MSITKEKTKHINELHFEHQLWLNEIGFYKDELGIFNNRLEEVASKYTNKEVLKDLEHFQNQFILQNELVDILRHDIKVHEQFLTATAIEHPVAIDHKAFTDHTEMRSQVDSFLKIYRELRNEYMKFLSRVM